MRKNLEQPADIDSLPSIRSILLQEFAVIRFLTTIQSRGRAGIIANDVVAQTKIYCQSAVTFLWFSAYFTEIPLV
jgi:hypothetical protein